MDKNTILLTTIDVAELYNLPRSTVIWAANNGHIDCLRTKSGTRLFTEEMVNDYLKKKNSNKNSAKTKKAVL